VAYDLKAGEICLKAGPPAAASGVTLAVPVLLRVTHHSLTLFQRLAVLHKEEHVEHKIQACTQTDMDRRDHEVTRLP
jgi:hypothetical protein